MTYGVSVLGVVCTKSQEEIIAKSKLIYWRLLDLVLKLDHIEGRDKGDQYINKSELNMESRLD